MEKLVLKPDRLDIDYDAKNDVLYISVGKPREADDFIEPQEGVVMRSRKGELIGITILGLKKHQSPLSPAFPACNQLTENSDPTVLKKIVDLCRSPTLRDLLRDGLGLMAHFESHRLANILHRILDLDPYDPPFLVVFYSKTLVEFLAVVDDPTADYDIEDVGLRVVVNLHG